ncbi:universal stress protein [Haloarchaeobius sp. DFWS5]|uniref:universal stress protein n=1 Tax=Haloarchaeobius sp. DFWS5 TaxID=3446114 RepID=UPI003EBCE1B6
MTERILIPTDGSETANAAVEKALELAELYDAEVHVLFVVDTTSMGITLGPEQVERVQNGKFGEMEDLEDKARTATGRVAEQARELGLVAEEHFRAGRPATVISHAADDLDVGMVVMGSHGRSGVTRAILGSVTEHVLRETDRPVLVVDQRREADDE